MTWEFKVFPAKPGRAAQERRLETGLHRLPAHPPLPRRDSFFARTLAPDWAAAELDFVEYWGKVSEVLPRYYGGRVTPDPLIANGDHPVLVDNGWNRIVFILDPVYKKVTTNLWVGDQMPKHVDRVWVMIQLVTLDRASHATSDTNCNLRARVALAGAARRPAGMRAVAELQLWRNISFWFMEAYCPGTLRPLLSE